MILVYSLKYTKGQFYLNPFMTALKPILFQTLFASWHFHCAQPIFHYVIYERGFLFSKLSRFNAIFMN